MLAVSANGTKAGSGIVWAVVPLDGDANQQRGVNGIVLALDAQDVTRTLRTSEQITQRDRLGLFPKFVPPTVADGKVFVATYGDEEPRRVYPDGPQPVHPTTFPKNYYVAVYGLLRAPLPGAVLVNQKRDDVTVVRASTTLPLPVAANQCTPLDPGSVDCTDALARVIGSPAFHRVILPANQIYPRALCSGSRRRARTAGWQTPPASASGAPRRATATRRPRIRAGSFKRN